MHILNTYLSVVLQLTVVVVYLYRLAYFKRKSTDKHAHEKIEKKYLFYFLNLVFLGILVMHGYLYDHIIGNP